MFRKLSVDKLKLDDLQRVPGITRGSSGAIDD
jgi:hypothetical protein